MNVVNFAWQVIDMQRTIEDQAREIERLQKIEAEYRNFVDETSRLSAISYRNMFTLMTTDGVADLVREKRNADDFVVG